jgi:hypothetical protein
MKRFAGTMFEIVGMCIIAVGALIMHCGEILLGEWDGDNHDE